MSAIGACADGRERGRVWFAHALRGVACLTVVWEHLAQDYFAGPSAVRVVAFVDPNPHLRVAPPQLQETIYRWLAELHLTPGQTAVFVFFVVSGFVIPFSLERRTVGGFAVRRFFRIYPTLWAAIALTLTALAVQAHFLHTAFPYGRQAVGSSALLFGVYVGQPWIDPVYWTLAVEEAFYALAVLCAWRGLLNRKLALVSVTVGLLAVAVSLAPSGPPAYRSLAWTVPEALSRTAGFVILIMIGIVFHQHYRGRWSTWASLGIGSLFLGAFAVSLYGGPFPDHQPSVYLCSGVAAVAIFTALYAGRDRIPRSRVIDALANISYPLYVVHLVTGWVILHALTNAIASFYVAVPLTVAAVVALAALVHAVIEVPSMRRGRQIANRRRFLRHDDEPESKTQPVPVVASGLEVA